MQSRRAPLIPTASLTALAALAACSSSNPEPPFAAGMVDSTGGTVEVLEGNQAGTRVEVAEGALAAPTEIRILRGFPSPVPGYLPLGRAIALQPEDVSFLVPATLTLPQEADPSQGAPVVILERAADGTVVELAPVIRDTMNGVAITTLTSFSTVWPAERTFGGQATMPYLPIRSGNTWNFEQDLVVTMEQVSDEPNLDGITVTRLTFATPDRDFGLYLQTDFELGTLSLGEFSTTGDESFQLIHDPVPFLQSTVTLGQPIESNWRHTLYAPFGATDPVAEGLSTQRLNSAKPAEIEVPAGIFEDLLWLDYRFTATDDDGTERAFNHTFLMGNEVGFLEASILGLDVQLVTAVVDGDPIGGD